MIFLSIIGRYDPRLRAPVSDDRKYAVDLAVLFL